MKTTKDTLLNRRSIRRYERQPIPDESLDFIYEAIRNTPTSYNGQQFSVIDIDCPDMKKKLYEITGQKQIRTCQHFLVFCADYNKIACLAALKDIKMPQFPYTADGIIVSIIDASLAMMSAIVAAESVGLGTCPIGYIRTASPEAISRILRLPKSVFAVCGLAIGIPREMPDIKPKQPSSLLIHHNHYRQDDLTAELTAYDNTISHYNKIRAGNTSDNDWVSHILSYYQHAMSYNSAEALRSQGFDFLR